MPTGYMLNWSDNTLKPPFLLPEATVDNHTTSLQLTGKRVVNWGEFLNENMLHLLEHGFSKTAPNNPTIGQLWLDANSGDLKIFTSQLTWNVIVNVPGIGTQTTTPTPLPNTSTSTSSTSTSTSTTPPVPTINWSNFQFIWDLPSVDVTKTWNGEVYMNADVDIWMNGVTASDNTPVKFNLTGAVTNGFVIPNTIISQGTGQTIHTPSSYADFPITAFTDSGASDTKMLSELLPSGAYPWQAGYQVTWITYPWPYRFNA